MTSKIGPNSNEFVAISLDDAPAPAASLHHLIPPAPETEFEGFYLVQVDSSPAQVTKPSLLDRVSSFIRGPIQKKPIDKFTSTQAIPLFKTLSSQVEKDLDKEGLYRVSGSKPQIDQALATIKKNINSPIPSFDDIHVVTGLIKALFLNRDHPLLHSQQTQLLTAAQESDPVQKEQLINSALHALPLDDRELFLQLVLHLRKIKDNSGVNKMTTENLSRGFSQILFDFDLLKIEQQKQLVAHIIDNHHDFSRALVC